MDWASLKGSYLRFDKSFVVDRWEGMSDYFIPSNDMSVEYDDGEHTITVYKIKKGSLFYHGSSVDIKSFGRLAFFSPHMEISKTILSLLAKHLLELTPTGRVRKQKAYLYTLEARRDMYVVYNLNMGLGANFAGQFSPFLTNQPIPEFCKEYAWLDGFVSFRDAAPLFPILRLNLNKSTQDIEDILKSLRGPRGNTFFMNEYLHYNSYQRKDPIYTAEYVFCQPLHSLKVVKKEILDMGTLFSQWKQQSIEWLQEMKSIPSTQRSSWIEQKKYDFMIGPIVPKSRRLYRHQFIVYKNKITLGEEIPSHDPLLFKNIQRVTEEQVFQFWAPRLTLKEANTVLPQLVRTHPSAVLHLLLFLCEKKEEIPTLRTLYQKLF